MSQDPKIEWTLKDCPFHHYTQLVKATEAIRNDATFTDATLHRRAQRHLEVLDKFPDYGPSTTSSWGSQILLACRGHGYPVTAKGFIGALYHTADFFGMRGGHRYVSATICACADILRGPNVEPDQERLARELTSLAFDIWFVQFWLPFNHPAGMDIVLSERTTHQVMVRDGCSCVATGVLGDITEDGRSLSKGSVLTIVPILHQSSAGWEEEDSLNDDMALANEKFTNLRVAHFLQAYCQMDLRFGLPVDDPRNCLLLSWRAASTFRECRWTLHPTEIPNSYRIKVYGAPSEVFGTTSIKEYVAFSDEKTDPECLIVPPHPDVLRAHAMFASVLHLSGMVDTTDPTRLDDNNQVLLQTAGHPGDDSSIRQEVRGAPSMPGIWSRLGHAITSRMRNWQSDAKR